MGQWTTPGRIIECPSPFLGECRACWITPMRRFPPLYRSSKKNGNSFLLCPLQSGCGGEYEACRGSMKHYWTNRATLEFLLGFQSRRVHWWCRKKKLTCQLTQYCSRLHWNWVKATKENNVSNENWKNSNKFIQVAGCGRFSVNDAAVFSGERWY